MGSFLDKCWAKAEEDQHSPKDQREVIRFFMVGTGAAGKTTVIRQLRCLCKERPNSYKVYDEDWNRIPIDQIFSDAEMARFRRIIQNNIATAMYNLIKQSSEWGHECQCPKSAEAIVSAVETAGTHPFAMSVPASLKVDLLEVFRDENIAATLHIHHRMARKWRIEDGTLKFLSESQIERLFNENAELTSTDIVHLRYPTTGVQDFRFSIKDTYIQIHDMGGQPTEMMQIPVFMQEWIASDQEGYKNYLLFVTSMADFNVEDEEEPSRTAMERSIRILDRILGVSTINSCGVLIFYNKQDRFDSVVTKLEETIEGRDELIRYLGEALSAEAKRKIREGSCPLESMREAIAVKYDNVINQRRKGKRVYARYTQAVDPKIMADIFNMIKSEIIDHYITNITFPI